MMANTTRTIPAETRGRIQAMRAAGLTMEAIAAETGVAISSVHRISNEPTDGADRVRPDGTVMVVLSAEEAGRLPGQETLAVAAGILGESLKSRILKAVTDYGPFPNSAAVMLAIQRPTDNWSHHEVVSILHQLRKQGKVRFRIDKKPKGGRSIGNLGGGDPTNIELVHPAPGHGVKPGGTNQLAAKADRLPELENKVTGTHPAGYSRARHAVGRDYTEARRHGNYANGGPISRTVSPPETASVPAEPAPEPQRQPGSFPLLTELQQRLRGRQAADAQSAKLMEAAAILEAIDPDESARLLAKAEALGGEPFSALEAEFLRYAETHRWVGDE
jgi:transcriptional regulator with XRE-family HTH domain